MSPGSLLVAYSTVTAAAGLPDSVTVNVRLPPSPPEASLTDSVAGSFAPIVPWPIESPRLIAGGKLLEGSDSVTLNVSSPSASSSSVAATVNGLVSPPPVAPTAKETLPAVLVMSDCTAVSPDRIPLAKSTVTGLPGLPDRVTMKVTLPPSAPEASLTDRLAGSLRLIVPLPVPVPMLMPAGKLLDGSDRVTVNVSSPSASKSSAAATSNVLTSPMPVAAVAKVSVPLVLVKSDWIAVSPDPTLVA